jgi:hypothetical protein
MPRDRQVAGSLWKATDLQRHLNDRHGHLLIDANPQRRTTMRHLIAILALLAIPAQAQAWGEIFELKMNGWEYCENGDSERLNARTAIPMWVRLDSGEAWTVSFSPNFSTNESFTLYINSITSQVKRNTSAVVGGTIWFAEDAFVNIAGTLKRDTRRGGWKKLKGIFIQNQLVWIGCHSSGKISTGKRLN